MGVPNTIGTEWNAFYLIVINVIYKIKRLSSAVCQVA